MAKITFGCAQKEIKMMIYIFVINFIEGKGVFVREAITIYGYSFIKNSEKKCDTEMC